MPVGRMEVFIRSRVLIGEMAPSSAVDIGFRKDESASTPGTPGTLPQRAESAVSDLKALTKSSEGHGRLQSDGVADHHLA